MDIGLKAHERVNHSHEREARASSVADRGLTTIGVPAEDLAGQLQATHSVGARRKPHTARWHLENVGSASCVEYVRPIEEARERLTVLTVADEAEPRGWLGLTGGAAHVAAPAPKRELYGHACRVIAADVIAAPVFLSLAGSLPSV
jgi:hypothetical protein